jgi:hypothetical protein
MGLFYVKSIAYMESEKFWRADVPRRNQQSVPSPLFILLLCLLCWPVAGLATDPWRSLGEGLELAEFDTGKATLLGDGRITILRIDPARWQFKILSAKELGYQGGLTAEEWSKRHNLSAVINAGLFLPDHSTHAGFMKVDDSTSIGRNNGYQSLAAFSPVDGKPPRFRIYDLDSEKRNITELSDRYRYAVQNLRLIKRPGVNRWKPQNRRWSEAALGEDRQGRALFIYSQTPFSMYELNNILLSLPIDLVSAQHLEGGREAQMHIRHDTFEKGFTSSIQHSFFDKELGIRGWPIPNVIGILPVPPKSSPKN